VAWAGVDVGGRRQGFHAVPLRRGQDGRDAIAAALTALDYDRGRTRSIADIVIPARPQE